MCGGGDVVNTDYSILNQFRKPHFSLILCSRIMLEPRKLPSLQVFFQSVNIIWNTQNHFENRNWQIKFPEPAKLEQKAVLQQHTKSPGYDEIKVVKIQNPIFSAKQLIRDAIQKNDFLRQLAKEQVSNKIHKNVPFKVHKIRLYALLNVCSKWELELASGLFKKENLVKFYT